MRDGARKSLKSSNVGWLISLVTFDVLALLLVVLPDVLNTASLNQFAVIRLTLIVALPVAVLLVNGAIPHSIKATMVYWKVKNNLPGCQAFTKHGPADQRIDMVALRKNVGRVPTEPAEQNALWYKLFKHVESDLSVAEAHKTYLLYRDMAALSFFLAFTVPLVFVWTAMPATAAVTLLALGSQYVIAAIAARNSGVRLVCNVLAIYSAKGPATNGKAGRARN